MNNTKNKIMENIQKYKTDKKTHQLTTKKNISNFYEQETFIKLFQTFYNYVKPMYSIHAKKRHYMTSDFISKKYIVKHLVNI